MNVSADTRFKNHLPSVNHGLVRMIGFIITTHLEWAESGQKSSEFNGILIDLASAISFERKTASFRFPSQLKNQTDVFILGWWKCRWKKKK